MKKKKVVRIGGSLAAVMTLATAVVIILRRVNRRGINYNLFETIPPGKSRQERGDQKVYLPSLSIFEGLLTSDPEVVQKADGLKDEIYGAAADPDTCDPLVSELFAVLTQFSPDLPRTDVTVKFRDDLLTIAGHLGTLPLRSQMYLEKWANWWKDGENFLDPDAMWVGLTAVQVGRTYLERFPPRDPHTKVTHEYDHVSRLLRWASDALTDKDAGRKFEVLTQMHEYLLAHGLQLA